MSTPPPPTSADKPQDDVQQPSAVEAQPPAPVPPTAPGDTAPVSPGTPAAPAPMTQQMPTPAPMPAGVPAPYAQPVPGAPAPVATPPVAASPNAVGNEFQALWQSVKDIFTGYPRRAFARGRASRFGWLITLGIFALTTGIIYFTMTMRAADLGNSLLAQLDTHQRIDSFGAGLVSFILSMVGSAIVIAILMATRALAIFATAKIHKLSQVRYVDALQVLGVAFLPLAVVNVILALVTAVPIPALTGLAMFLVVLIAIPMFNLVELLVYMGTSQLGRYDRSPVITYVVATFLSYFVTAIATIIVSTITLAITAASLGH